VVGSELRSRAIDLVVEKKKKRQEVADLFGVDRKTVYLWVRTYKTEGRKEGIVARTGPGKRRKLIPLEFKEFIDKNKSMTIQQMCSALRVGKSAVATAMRAIGYTRKKNNSSTKSVKKKNDKLS
jgi:transposase